MKTVWQLLIELDPSLLLNGLATLLLSADSGEMKTPCTYLDANEQQPDSQQPTNRNNAKMD